MGWRSRIQADVLAGSVPRLLVVSGLVLTLQAVLVLATGRVLLFLLQFPVANLALCVLFAWTAPTGRPLVAQLAAEVVALRQPSAAHPGLDRFFRGVTWLWAGIFAASAIGLVILLAVAPVPVFPPAHHGFSPGWADRGRRAGYPVRSGISTALFPERTGTHAPHARRRAPVPGRAASWRERPRDAGPRPSDGWKFTERVAEFRYLDTTPLAGSAPTQLGTHAQ
jgi:hypothetical protein